MVDYPKLDGKVIMLLSDGKEITGDINIAGRDMISYLQAPDPDILLYNSYASNEVALKTLFVTKEHVLWIASAQPGKDRTKAGDTPNVKIKLENGELIKGSVDISGYERLSDFFRDFDDNFLEVWNCTAGDRTLGYLYIYTSRILWKEPLE